VYSPISEKIKDFLLDLFSKYIVWAIVAAVIIIWWFFPYLMETMATIIFFWAPAIILIFSFIIAMTRNSFKAKRDKEQGLYQYDIVVTITDFYLVDLLIYGGALAILTSAYLLNPQGLNIIDLLQALIYFILASLIKRVFYQKVLK